MVLSLLFPHHSNVPDTVCPAILIHRHLFPGTTGDSSNSCYLVHGTLSAPFTISSGFLSAGQGQPVCDSMSGSASRDPPGTKCWEWCGDQEALGVGETQQTAGSIWPGRKGWWGWLRSHQAIPGPWLRGANCPSLARAAGVGHSGALCGWCWQLSAKTCHEESNKQNQRSGPSKPS